MGSERAPLLTFHEEPWPFPGLEKPTGTASRTHTAGWSLISLVPTLYQTLPISTIYILLSSKGQIQMFPQEMFILSTAEMQNHPFLNNQLFVIGEFLLYSP